MIETEFGDVRKGPGQEMPQELMHAKLVAQHAQGILADILRGGSLDHDLDGNLSFPAEKVVRQAFTIADEFDKEFQKRMNAAVQSLPKIQRPPTGMIVK